MNGKLLSLTLRNRRSEWIGLGRQWEARYSHTRAEAGGYVFLRRYEYDAICIGAQP